MTTEAVSVLPETVRALPRALRNLDPWLHIDPCYVNAATCTKIFGYYFKEFYLSRTIKENTEYARIFNDHMLVTFAMDACRDRAVRTLGEVLCDPAPGEMFCSIEALEGTEAMRGEQRARNRVLLPCDFDRDVFIDVNPLHFLSETERDQQTRPSRMAVMGQIDLVKPAYVSATPLLMGTPTFTHFRNEGAALDLAEYAADWFETWLEDIDELASAADIAVPEDAVRSAALAALPGDALLEALGDILGGVPMPAEPGARTRMIACGVHRGGVELPCAAMVVLAGGGTLLPDMLRAAPDAMAALAATPAELWIVLHGGRIDPRVREMVHGFAVRPHAPRRYCLIDGADLWRILALHGKIRTGTTMNTGRRREE